MALAAPKHVRATEGAGAYDHERPTPQKMGWAFMEYIERYPTDRLPKMGGMAATVVLTAEADVSPKTPRKLVAPRRVSASHPDNCCGGRARRR